jgi:hypothetical protein
MASDKLFYKRKARKASELARRKASRAPYSKVLIVCEGAKTEPNYFNELKDHYKLNNANIKITGEGGSNPLSVVRLAKQLYRGEKEAGDQFDNVFCVFDRNGHTDYRQALDQINTVKPNNVFRAITSVPCFEYWLLLHFRPHTGPYRAVPGRSACDQVIADLRGHMRSYKKGSRGIFGFLLDRLDTAKINAERCLIEVRKAETDNPSTKIHQLIQFLQELNQ